MSHDRATWQPLTYRGVAGFARGSYRRLFFFQMLFALGVAGAVLWFLDHAWLPELRQAITQLPPDGAIRNGHIENFPPYPRHLVDGLFLSLVLDPTGDTDFGQTADLQIEFEPTRWKVGSLFGYLDVPYPPVGVLPLNRNDLQAWWGAWEPALLGGLILSVIAILFASWFLLASLYSFPTWLFAFFCDRRLTWTGSWRLASAALLPAAFFMAVTIILYGLHRLGLIGLLVGFALHFAIGWFYLPNAVTRLARIAAVPRPGANPFGSPKEERPR